MQDPAPIHEHALDNLRYIRETMERAGSFTSIPGWGGVAVGISAIAAAVLAHPYAGTRRWMLVWLSEAVLAAVIGTVTMVRKARRGGASFRSGPARRFFAGYFAPIVAGAILTAFLGHAGLYALLPATWMLLYGTSFISSGASSIPAVPAMGLCFMLLGATAGFVPIPVANVLLGAAFGGLHLIFGFVIARRYGG